MKKTLLLLVILVNTIPAFSQMGITIGGNLAKYEYTSDRKPVFGINAGLFYRQSLNEKLKMKAELTYTGKGATVYLPTPIGNTNPVERYINHINFVQLTLPFYYDMPIEEFSFQVGAGPYAAYMVSATHKAENWDGTSSTGNFSIGNNTSDDFKAFDAGINFLAGFTLGDKLGFHVKYDLGLSNLSPDPAYPPLKMRSLSFSISYGFGE